MGCLNTIRTWRLIITCLMLFLITWYYQVPERIWSLITVWFVMTEYTSVGGVYKKGFYRFAGTFMSALYGMVIIYFFANNVMINMLAFVAGVFVYMYYFLDSEKMYIGVIGSVTLSIVLLNHNDLDAAILRTFNIVLGILASMFMIRFFYPKYARDEVIATQQQGMQQLTGLLNVYLDKSKTQSDTIDAYLHIESDLLKTFQAFDKHLNEAKVEVGSQDEFIKININVMAHIRRLFRLISVFMNDLSTDISRADAKLHEELTHVLNALEHIQYKLTHHSPASDFIFSKNALPLHPILASIHNQLSLLNDAISDMIFKYEQQHRQSNSRFWQKGSLFRAWINI